MTVSLKIAHGTAKVEDMTIVGPAVNVALAGSASIPERDLDLTGTAALVVTAESGGHPFELPFVVQGPWDDPMMLPDVEALIRRSRAAAPLLNAAREHNARDAVRSVLERLTGGGDAPSVPSADAAAPANAQAR
jgi:AsmA protein